MVDIEYQVLLYVEETGGCHWIELLNALSSQEPVSSLDRIVKNMVKKGLLSCSGLELSSYYLRITPKGELAKKALEEHRNKEAKAKREDERKENKARRVAIEVAWIGAIGAIVSALITVIVPFFLSA